MFINLYGIIMRKVLFKVRELRLDCENYIDVEYMYRNYTQYHNLRKINDEVKVYNSCCTPNYIKIKRTSI